MVEMYDIGKLLNTAWKVYHNRDSKDGDRCQQNKRGDRRKSSNGLKRSTPLLDKDQCAVSRKKGDWKNGCSG